MTNNKLTNNQCGICADCTPQINGGSGFNNCAEAHAAQTAGDKAAMNNKLTGLRYGHNAQYLLSELASYDADDIDGDEFEVYGEDSNGREGSATISITELAADAAKLLAAKDAELQEYRNAGEPVMYQHRFRPSWRDSQPWTAWAECSAGVYGDSERYTATPDSAGYLYDVRKLYAAPQPAHVPQGGKAVQALTTEIMELVDRITGHRLSVAKMSELRPCIFEACRAAMQSGAGPAEKCRSSENAQVVQSGAVKDGWVMVPEEPTHEMLEAGDEQFGTYDVYRRMLAAAPQQEAE
ncbi:hypothetical protein [Lelliottia wanjuensis]|uniref:Uncharacterized protein n=1 Tax=Lelliottia wanjuensis TaxID=3050585 RepID=A0AAP4FX95_9ENTR|nr:MULTISPECIES: hypothetical protein [unclassified Lelliottia]MDK9365358.1 hypothetical protein [Lelliottia sp. V106_12]MDK9617891.1 hypothetical protein [Lelliottia sp. V106_9]